MKWATLPCFSTCFMMRVRSNFEQARDDHHDGGAGFLDIRGELFESFGIENLRPHADREILPAGILIGRGEREEGQETFVR